METAATDEYFKGNVNYTKLQSINRCRLYMQCFFISELMDNDKTTIHPDYLLNGEKRLKHQELTFPEIRMPSQYEWNE